MVLRVGRADASFSVDAHMRVTSTLDEGNAYHSEVLDFELNGGDKGTLCCFIRSGEKCVLCVGRKRVP